MPVRIRHGSCAPRRPPLSLGRDGREQGEDRAGKDAQAQGPLAAKAAGQDSSEELGGDVAQSEAAQNEALGTGRPVEVTLVFLMQPPLLSKELTSQ